MKWEVDRTYRLFNEMREEVRGLRDRLRDGRRSYASLANGRVTHMVERLCSLDSRICVPSEGWNQDRWLLGTPGGTFDLREGRLRPSRPEDYISSSTSVTPEEGEAPLWEKFLREACGGDEKDVEFLRSVVWLLPDRAYFGTERGISARPWGYGEVDVYQCVELLIEGLSCECEDGDVYEEWTGGSSDGDSVVEGGAVSDGERDGGT